MADKFIKIGVSMHEYETLLTVSKEMNYKSPSNLFRKFVEHTVARKTQNSPLGASAAENFRFHSTDDELRTPIDTDLATDIAKRKAAVLTTSKPRTKLTYGKVGKRLVPLHKGKKTGLRLPVTDDTLLYYEELNPHGWEDITSQLTPFEKEWLNAWVNDFDWMYDRYDKMVNELGNYISTDDYVRIIQIYNEFKERE